MLQVSLNSISMLDSNETDQKKIKVPIQSKEDK
jgi:hypothetical protein